MDYGAVLRKCGDYGELMYTYRLELMKILETKFLL